MTTFNVIMTTLLSKSGTSENTPDRKITTKIFDDLMVSYNEVDPNRFGFGGLI